MRLLRGIAVFVSAIACGIALADVRPDAQAPDVAWATKSLRAGIIGTDTSHVPAFAKTLRSRPDLCRNSTRS